MGGGQGQHRLPQNEWLQENILVACEVGVCVCACAREQLNLDQSYLKPWAFCQSFIVNIISVGSFLIIYCLSQMSYEVDM